MGADDEEPGRAARHGRGQAWHNAGMDMRARDIHVDGIVQGVGFRPFVARLARAQGLRGWVKNAPDGVDIHVELPEAADAAGAAGADEAGRGTPDGETGTAKAAADEALDAFEAALRTQAPAAARIVSLQARAARAENCDAFEIRASATGGLSSTLVSPDLATCDACLAELFDPGNRRYHYPFINCTNCGPRFTIIDELPYDRPATSMRGFPMCEACADEYADEADRRYHAQPDACFACGPSLWFTDGADAEIERAGHTRETSDALIEKTAAALREGKVAAVKGLGGWHLACDARDEAAVAALRARKHRPSKPLAVMVKDLEAAHKLCHVGDEEAALLASPARPIVLLRTREGAGLAPGVANPLPETGVMLPSTPVQHLLFDVLGSDAALVMTSGNRSGEPIVAEDAEALDALAGIADVFLGNDRPIVARYDDSVVRMQRGIGGADATSGTAGSGNDAGEAENAGGTPTPQLVRRARGYAPMPLFVQPAQDEEAPEDAAPPVTIFAAGSEQKATFTYLAPAPGTASAIGTAPDTTPVPDIETADAAGAPSAPGPAFTAPARAWVSQHLGDLEHLGAWRAWEQAKKRYEQLFDLRADALACDLHPEYLASKWAREKARETGLPLVEVQHHHAHIAAVMGEHALRGQVLGVALDGTGYGPDATIWGCELFAASRADYERLWHLPTFFLPGGAAAVLHPERSAFGLLAARSAEPIPPDDPAAWMNLVFTMDNPQWQPFLDALEDRALYAQMTARRLNCPSTSSLGRFLDAMAALLGRARGCIGYDGEPACLLEAAALRELEQGSASLPAAHEIAARADATRARLAAGEPLTAFTVHLLVARTIIEACENARERTGLARVALGGGCMVNRLLHELLVGGLGQRGFSVYENIELAPNDACLSYGQAVVARARLAEGGAHVPGDTGESAG